MNAKTIQQIRTQNRAGGTAIPSSPPECCVHYDAGLVFIFKGRIMTATKCDCGAVTVSCDEPRFSNSMTMDTFLKEFPNIPLEDEMFCNCNHCVNHWGLDLCGCGSGEPVGECGEGYDECKNNIPSQVKCQEKPFVGWAR